MSLFRTIRQWCRLWTSNGEELKEVQLLRRFGDGTEAVFRVKPDSHPPGAPLEVSGPNESPPAPETKTGGDAAPPKFTDTDRAILDVLQGNPSLKSATIAIKAGLEFNSYFRSRLRYLVAQNLVEISEERKYFLRKN